MPDWPEAAKSRGVEEMRRTWQQTLAAWDDFRAEPEDFIDAGDHVVVLTRATARGKGSGVDVRADTATVWTIREGKVTHLALYWNVPNAIEAAGLPPHPDD
jgi:ketosteroid isomerase-like protein